ncbi:hypothetical protein JTB14_028247 [Gonioctena quinquepunctata]|nr:hypothetical protein JTB14_028247 [Gonioctena quinquepunctata]
MKDKLGISMIIHWSKFQPMQPEISLLPECRLKSFTRPVSYCGVDYFVPLLVKVRRIRIKRYGVLSTCFNTRAVHIELANSSNTDLVLMVLRRIISRRGRPIEMHSDNGVIPWWQRMSEERFRGYYTGGVWK